MSPLAVAVRRAVTLAILAAGAIVPLSAQPVPPVATPRPTSAELARSERAGFLEMFARAYYPGRSGQIMVVPREGEILTRPGADVPFMHGSPWSYDTHIPMVFWGSRYVRPGRLTEAATQQDVAPTIAQAIGLPMPGVTGHALADRWTAATDGRAVVVAQSSTANATALAGHGACLFNGRPVVFASYDVPTGKWATNAQCYRLPDYLKTADVRTLWEGTDGTWMGHPAANPDEIRRTAPFARFEGDALVSMIEHEAIGADDVTDLVLANLKPVDYVGHAYGPDSAELRDTVTEIDRQIGRVLEAVAAKAGPEGYLAVITADHAMPPEPAPGRARR